MSSKTRMKKVRDHDHQHGSMIVMKFILGGATRPVIAGDVMDIDDDNDEDVTICEEGL